MLGIQTLLLMYITFPICDFGSSYTLGINETAKREEIIGGTNVDIEDSPYFVQVFPGHLFCGGSLLSQKHVLTARHCVKHVKKPSKVTILAGSGVFKRFMQSRQGMRIHFPDNTQFNNDYEGNDIAIITVNEPFTSNSLGTVQLPSRRPNNGDFVAIRGLGVTEIGGTVANKLKKVLGRVTDCVTLKSKDICVETRMSSGICLGDSGSPLINVKGELVGIASRLGIPSKDCASGCPDYYASVYDHREFITKTINGEVNSVVGQNNKWIYVNSQSKKYQYENDFSFILKTLFRNYKTLK